MDSQRKADLHIHTNASDGYFSPEDILVKLKDAGIQYAALTDHDSVAALDTFSRKAVMYDIRTVPGVEVSAEFKNLDLHFLGYFINHHNKRFLDYLYLFRRRRYQRAQEMIGKLAKLDIQISIEKVEKSAQNGPIGRPHLADALIEGGWASSREDAFQKYLRSDGPVYVEKFRISAGEVIELLHSIGGAVFLAHPGISCDDRTIEELIGEGLDGIEVVHSKHSPDMTAYYTSLAEKHSLLTCGGSDYHGDPHSALVLGKFTVSVDDVNRIEQYCKAKREEWGIIGEGEEIDKDESV